MRILARAAVIIDRDLLKRSGEFREREGKNATLTWWFAMTLDARAARTMMALENMLKERGC